MATTVPTPDRTALDIVRAWHDLLNAGDAEAVLALATDDVRVGGSRGSGTGKDLLREWVQWNRATVTVERVAMRGDTVVVDQMREWTTRSGMGNARQGMATSFRIAGGKIVAVARYEHFGAAMNKSGLDEDHLLPDAFSN
jgi:ketosteroid isomerase-like protein